MAVATASDVQARVGRPLNPQETSRVNAYLADAEAEIFRVAPDRLTDPDWKPAVVAVECAMVIRAARLPDALDSVVPDIENASFQSRPLTQGAVYIRRDERRRLGLPLIGAGDISPDIQNQVYGHEPGWPDWPWWQDA